MHTIKTTKANKNKNFKTSEMKFIFKKFIENNTRMKQNIDTKMGKISYPG